jgi:hypothetical protein
MVWLIDTVLQLVKLFAGVALADPVSAALMLSGALLTAIPVLVGGYLAAGAVADLFTPA